MDFYSADFWTKKMEVIRSSETSVQIQITLNYSPEDGNILNYRCENLKSYNASLRFEQSQFALLRQDSRATPNWLLAGRSGFIPL
jgi:hypothetical protein